MNTVANRKITRSSAALMTQLTAPVRCGMRLSLGIEGWRIAAATPSPPGIRWTTPATAVQLCSIVWPTRGKSPPNWVANSHPVPATAPSSTSSAAARLKREERGVWRSMRSAKPRINVPRIAAPNTRISKSSRRSRASISNAISAAVSSDFTISRNVSPRAGMPAQWVSRVSVPKMVAPAKRGKGGDSPGLRVDSEHLAEFDLERAAVRVDQERLVAQRHFAVLVGDSLPRIEQIGDVERDARILEERHRLGKPVLPPEIREQAQVERGQAAEMEIAAARQTAADHVGAALVVAAEARAEAVVEHAAFEAQRI